MASPPLVSRSQSKLKALLGKTTSLVGFVPDHECDALFAQVAAFVQRALELKEQYRSAEFENMDILDLVKLGEEPKRERSPVEEDPQKRPRLDEAEPLSQPEGVGASVESLSLPEASVVSQKTPSEKEEEEEEAQPWDFAKVWHGVLF